MSSQNSKDNFNSNKAKKSLSTKELRFLDFNKKLQDFLSDIKSKDSSYQKNINNTENTYNDITSLKYDQKSKINNRDNVNLFNTNIDKNNKNNMAEYQFEKASIRLGIEKLLDSDQFAQNFNLIPSNDYDSNYELPYINSFNDNILLEDESIFFIFDNDYKNKFLSKEDLNNFKKEDIKLNFGKDPFEIYKQIYERKMLPHDKTSIEFYNSLNSFNIFKTRDPYFLNLKMEKINNEIEDDNFNMINNYNLMFNGQENYENIPNDSVISTRPNSKINHYQNQNNSYSILFEQDFFNNNENDADKREENEKEKRDKLIGKKRQNKK